MEPRIANRVQIQFDDNIVFVLQHDNTTKFSSIVNISSTGVALSANEFKETPTVGEIMSGFIKLRGNIIQVELKVVHITNSVMGCIVISKNGNYESQFRIHFKEANA